LPHFYKSFNLSNYEYTEKSYLTEHTDVKENQKDDPRSFRFAKTVDSVDISHESKPCLDEMKAVSDAVNFTRQLANTRASVCNPEYMEQEILKLV